MLVIHAQKIEDRVVIPYHEWKKIVQLLQANSEVKIIEQKEDTLSVLLGLAKRFGRNWSGW